MKTSEEKLSRVRVAIVVHRDNQVNEYAVEYTVDQEEEGQALSRAIGVTLRRIGCDMPERAERGNVVRLRI